MKPRERYQCVAVMLRVSDVKVTSSLHGQAPVHTNAEERNVPEIPKIIQGCPDALAEAA